MQIIYRDDIPEGCIADCSTPGQDVSDAVNYWQEKLNFVVNRNDAVEYLYGTGSWDDDELDKMTDAEINEKILWLACCDFNDGSDFLVLE